MYSVHPFLSVCTSDISTKAMVDVDVVASLHSVQIYDGNIDNIVTLYCLRCASGHLADYIWYMCYISPPDNIRYVLPLCPINSMTSAHTPSSYI